MADTTDSSPSTEPSAPVPGDPPADAAAAMPEGVPPEGEPEGGAEGECAAGAGASEAKLRKIELAYKAGALPRSVYERLVSKEGGVPAQESDAAAEGGGGGVAEQEEEVRAAVLGAQQEALERARAAGRLTAARYEELRDGCDTAPSSTPPLSTAAAADEQWPATLRLLQSATANTDEPMPFRERRELDAICARVTSAQGARIAAWLSARMGEACSSGAAGAAINTVALIMSLAERSSATLMREVAGLCQTAIEAAQRFESCSPPSSAADAAARAQQLVRDSAQEAMAVLRQAGVSAAQVAAEVSKAEALALDSRSSLRDLRQDGARPGFVATPKTRKEERKHQKMFRQMEKGEEKRMKDEKKQALQRAANAKTWATEVLPRFGELRHSKKVDGLLWDGIPFQVRGEVWTKAIGNASNVSETAYTERCQELEQLMASEEKPKWVSDIAVDLDRTFSAWVSGATTGRKRQLYEVANDRAKDGDECLRRVLGSYALHKPELGYTQGMSYIVAMLLLYNPPREAFMLLVNLLDKSLLFTMFQMDFGKLDAYWSLYEELLKRNLPKLWQHFTDMGVTPHQYLMDWFFTVFSRTVPLELSSMLWDHFVMHGDAFLFRAALGILKHIEPKLLGQEFEDVSWTLKHLSLSDNDQDMLSKTIKSIVVPDDLVRKIRAV